MSTTRRYVPALASAARVRARRIGVPAAVCLTGSLAAIAVSGLAGASTASRVRSAKSARTIDLTLWESHTGATNPVALAEQAIVNKFNASQHAVHMSILETSGSTKGLAAAQAGHPPVIAEVSHYDGPFRNSQLVINLTPLMTGPGGFSKSALNAFFPGVLSNGRIPQQVVNGHAVPGAQYRLSAGSKVSELFYNTAMFKQAGITGCPTTWTALGTDLVKLKKLGVTPMGWKDASAHIEPVVISNGGGLYKSGSNQLATAYDSQAGQVSLSQFRSWYGQHLFVFSHGQNMRTAMANKTLAIEEGTSAGWQKVLAATKPSGVVAGACPEPNGISGHSGNLIQGLGFVIFTGHSQAQQAAAFQFVKFFNSPQMQAYWSMHSGFAPTTRAALRYIPTSYLDSQAGQGLKISIEELGSPYSVPRGVSDSYAEVDQAVDAAFYNAVTGKQSVSQALAHLDQVDAGYLKNTTQI